jgi:hypothetical protein
MAGCLSRLIAELDTIYRGAIMKELIGKIITGLSVSVGEDVLAFEHQDGTRTIYDAYGDCCSETWFADITGVNALIGGIVISVDDVDMKGYNTDDGRGRQEEDEVYGYKIVTDKGYADIVFRNSSNGYYGGNVEFTARELPDGMIAITDDWSA